MNMHSMGTEEDGTTQATAAVRLCANGEPFARKSMAIPCQAAEDFGSAEGVETRGPSSNGNVPHERPAPRSEDEEIVRYPSESRGVSLNSSRRDASEVSENTCYGAIKMYTPTKNVLVKNIGRAAGSLGN